MARTTNMDNGNTVPEWHVKALCLAAVSGDLKVDSKAIAADLGVGPNKVSRKLNTVLNPVGYEMKGGKIVKIDGAAPDAGQDDGDDDGNDDDNEDATTPQKRKAGAPKKGKQSKKAKVEEA